MATLDITKTKGEKINCVRFLKEGSDPEAATLLIKSREILLTDSYEEGQLQVVSKSHAEYLIQALEYAIANKWFK